MPASGPTQIRKHHRLNRSGRRALGFAALSAHGQKKKPDLLAETRQLLKVQNFPAIEGFVLTERACHNGDNEKFGFDAGIGKTIAHPASLKGLVNVSTA